MGESEPERRRALGVGGPRQFTLSFLLSFPSQHEETCLSHEKGQGHESPPTPSVPQAVEGGGTFLSVGLHAGGTQAVPNVATNANQRKHVQVMARPGKGRHRATAVGAPGDGRK